MKRSGTPRTPAEKTLAAAAYAVYIERYHASGDCGAGWARAVEVVNGKIEPYFRHHATLTARHEEEQ